VCPGGQEISHFYGTRRLIVSLTIAQHKTYFDMNPDYIQTNTHTHTHFNIQFHIWGARWHSWLSQWTTSRKNVVSNTDGVIGIFIDLIFSAAL